MTSDLCIAVTVWLARLMLWWSAALWRLTQVNYQEDTSLSQAYLLYRFFNEVIFLVV